MKERFGLGCDRFLDWKAHLQLVVPRSRYIVYGDLAFKSVETACAMLEHGTYYSGLLKKLHIEAFPNVV